jgi:hypothetical protein
MSGTAWALYALRLFLAFLVAINVYEGVSSGSALSWGAAAFVAVIALTGRWDA